MNSAFIKLPVLAWFALITIGLSAQQSDPFPHTPHPLPNTVGPAGYIGTSGPTGNTPSGLNAPTDYDPGTATGPQALPNSNAINVFPAPTPAASTGPSGGNAPGVIGTTDYVVPRPNGVTGVTGLPGMPWP